MEAEGQHWSWDGKEEELFAGMARRGVQKLRIRLWTKEEGNNGRAYATEVVRRANAAGLDPYLVIFLSDDWADLMKQPAPEGWKDLELPARAEKVRSYSRDVVKHFRAAGLQSHLYEMGNEIDYGICGVYPSKSTKKNADSLSRRIWPDAASLIRASQQGVLEADPEAKFLLHIAHWWDSAFCQAFFQFMLGQEVRVDFAGLSYFPSSDIGGSLEMEQLGQVATDVANAIQRPIIIPETAYPGTHEFRGQFSRWKKEAPGYPLTPEGQERWLTDFLAYCAQHPAIDAVYYWSPEWCGEGMWKGFALFDPQGQARPAWSAFASRNVVKAPTYFEAHAGQLYRVPVATAREQARPILEEERQRAGRISVDYIKAITARPLVTDNYQVLLRATLLGNLDLKLASDDPAPDWKAQLEKLDAKHQKLVVFHRNPAEPLLPALRAFCQVHGLEVALHHIPLDKPLRFGFGL